MEALLDSASDDTWLAIQKLLQRETKSAREAFSDSLSSFDLERETEESLLTGMEQHARNVVESKAKEEAARVLIRMKDRYGRPSLSRFAAWAFVTFLHLFFLRFSTLFSRDSDSMPRVWTGNEDIRAITKVARSAVSSNRLFNHIIV